MLKKCDAYWIMYWTFCKRPLCDFNYCDFGKFQRKNESQICDQIVSVVLRWAKPKNHWAKIFHKKYRWLCGERHHKTNEPQFPIKSIGGFTVSDTEKPPQRKKKVSMVLPLTKQINDSKNSFGGFAVTSTDNSHRWFYRLLPVH